MSREEIASAISEYLEDHSVAELLEVLAYRVAEKEGVDATTIW